MTFNDSEEEEGPTSEKAGCSTESSVRDLDMWLEFQAGQLCTPAFWEELEAIPGIKDQCKFPWKIGASFYVPEVQIRASPEQGFTTSLAPPEFE